jgi:hypothetical protein
MPDPSPAALVQCRTELGQRLQRAIAALSDDGLPPVDALAITQNTVTAVLAILELVDQTPAWGVPRAT